MSLKKYGTVAIVMVAYGCTVEAPEQSATSNIEPAPTETVAAVPVQLVDSAITPAIAGKDGWNYHQTAETDVDGDGQAERVVMSARVELVRGRPAWDDGQPWQVYVEEPDGQRTYLYAQRLQLGTLTMRVTSADAGTPSIVLLENLPDRVSVYEAAYEGPARVTVETRLQRNVDPRGETASPRFP